MKWIPKTEENGIIKFLEELSILIQKNNSLKSFDMSDNLFSRIALTGDISGIPSFHFRWKTKILPDLIIWPTNINHLIQVIKISSKFSIPITVFAGGTSYFGSSVPAMGGIVLDMKKMNSFNIDKKNKLLRTQAGATFNSIIKELDKTNFSLPTYPTSYKSATLGGWFSSTNSLGFGTATYGSFVEQVQKINVVTPAGEIKKITNREEIKAYSESAGLWGIIVAMHIRLVPKGIINHYAFSFEKLDELKRFLKAIEKPKELYKILLVSFGDFIFHTTNKHNHLLLSIKGSQEKYEPYIMDELSSNNGIFMGSEFSLYLEKSIFKLDLLPKTTGKLLLMQIILIKNEKINLLIDEFKRLCLKYKIQTHYFSVMANINEKFRNGKCRIVFYIQSDNGKNNWMHFITSKAILHQIIKFGYKNGGKCYSYGLLNSLYLHKFDKERLFQERKKKNRLDHNLIMNPLKIVQTKIKYSRINIMFSIALLFRRLQCLTTRKKDLKIENKQLSFNYDSTALKNCVNCGMCRENCPNYYILQREEFSPSGRTRIFRTIDNQKISLTQKQMSDLGEIIFTCTTCNQCSTNCPISFDFTKELEKYRYYFQNLQPRKKFDN